MTQSSLKSIQQQVARYIRVPSVVTLLHACLLFSLAISTTQANTFIEGASCDKASWCNPTSLEAIKHIDKLNANQIKHNAHWFNQQHCNEENHMPCINTMFIRALCLSDRRPEVKEYSCNALSVIEEFFDIQPVIAKNNNKPITIHNSYHLNKYFRQALNDNHYQMPVFTLRESGSILLQVNLRGKYELDTSNPYEFFLVVDAIDATSLTNVSYIIGGKDNYLYIIDQDWLEKEI